ncbi:MAG: hypothetical protein HYU97_09735 [Deltaproteobacteria bacterium]|nr:hypothetical protein [Deltaproteobacteria bacterium]
MVSIKVTACELDSCGKSGPHPSLEVACQQVRKLYQKRFSGQEVECNLKGSTEMCDGDGDEATCKPIPNSAIVNLGAEGTLLKAGYFSLGFNPQLFLMAFQNEKGWKIVGEIFNFYSPGAGGVTSMFRIDQFEAVQLIPNGSKEVLFSYRLFGHDTDMGINRVTEWEDQYLHVCGIDNDTAYCSQRIPIKLQQIRKMLFATEEAELCQGKDKFCDPLYRLEVQSNRKWNPDAGTVTLQFKYKLRGIKLPRELEVLTQNLTGTRPIVSLPRF